MELQSALENKTGIGAATNAILSPVGTNAVPPVSKKAVLFPAK